MPALCCSGTVYTYPSIMLTSIPKSFMISIKSYVRENMRNEMENLGSIKVVPNYFSRIKIAIFHELMSYLLFKKSKGITKNK